jgi:hypothetical protein
VVTEVRRSERLRGKTLGFKGNYIPAPKKSLSSSVPKWFYDSSTDTATRAAHCGSFLEGPRSLGIELRKKHGEHEHLRGSGRQRVIPYIYGECCCIAVCVLFKQGVELGCSCHLSGLSLLKVGQLHWDPGPNRWPQGS